MAQDQAFWYTPLFPPYPHDPGDGVMNLMQWVKKHNLSLLTLSFLLTVVGGISALNMANYPMRFEDEGTYVAQAWAMQYRGELAHYTYWYDHPPVGWAQLAGWTTATDAFDRNDSAITAGREFMVFMRVVSAALLFVLARRIGLSRLWSSIAVLLFGLSPLSVEFGRYVLLDNIALPWLLGAFVLALSPRKSLAAVAGSAFCMAIAILSKETLFLLLPALIYALWRNSDKRNRRFGFVLFGSILIFVGSFYILYAALKNELFEGSGHVSLIGAIKWQLLDRAGSGSILDASSGAYGLLNFWLSIDPWLLSIGVVLLPVAIFVGRLRIIAIALLIQVLLIFRTGYLPFPYIIAMLPFAALIIAGIGDVLMSRISQKEMNENWKLQARAALVVVAMAAFMQVVAPAWGQRLIAGSTFDADKPARDTVAWIADNASREDRVIIDSALWVDLIEYGFVNPEAVWLYKTETDPEIIGEIGKVGDIDYIAVSAPTLDSHNAKVFPTLFKVKENSIEVASFGEGSNKMVILRVSPKPAGSGSEPTLSSQNMHNK